MPETTVRSALTTALREHLAADPRSLLLGETVWSGGASGVTANLFDEFGAERVWETPVSENALLQAALGLSLSGFRPIVEVYSADFMLAVANELINDIAKWRAQHGRPRDLPVTVRAPMGANGGLGPEHSQSMERYFYHAPGLRLAVPGSPQDAAPLLRTILREAEPTIFLEHRRLYDVTYDDALEQDVAVGRARVARPGDDATVVAWGWMVTECLRAADQIAREGLNVEVLDLRWIVPMDTATILGSVAKSGRLLTVEEGPRRGGVGAEIVSTVVEELGPAVRIARLGMGDCIHPYHPDIERQLIPDAGSVAAAVARLCGGTDH